MIKKLLATLGMGLGFALCAAPALAITVSFAPVQTHINVGESASVEVNISGLGDEILAAFDLDVLYDDAVVGSVAAVPNLEPFGGAPDTLYASQGCGTGCLDVSLLSLLDDTTLPGSQANAFIILTLSFSGISDGAFTLQFGSDPLFGRNFVGLDAESLNVDIGTACIAVGAGACATVPEPSSTALAAIALLVALGVRQRQHMRRSQAGPCD